MKKIIFSAVTAYAVSLFICGSAQAVPYKGSDSFLTGDWRGHRTALLESGIDTQIKYTADYWNVLDGGYKDGGNLISALDVAVELDGSLLYGIPNNKTKIRVVHISGGDINKARLGSVEGIDNLEAETNSIKLQELWTEQKFDNGKYRVRLGVQDLNEDFAKTEMTANFSKPSMQLMPTLANSGKNNTASTYPDPALAITAEYAPTQLYYMKAGVFDGAAGSSDKKSGTHLKLDSSEGAMLIAEAGITPRIKGDEHREPNKLALGYWRYTKSQQDLAVAGKQEVNQGIYAMMAYEFYADRAGRSLGAFVKGGISDEDTHQVDFDLQAGFVGKGFVPSRPLGEFGLGYTQAENSDDYMRANLTADDREYSLNAYYRDQVIPGIVAQPEFQYISNPGSDKSVDSASILGMRLEFNL